MSEFPSSPSLDGVMVECLVKTRVSEFPLKTRNPKIRVSEFPEFPRFEFPSFWPRSSDEVPSFPSLDGGAVECLGYGRPMLGGKR